LAIGGVTDRQKKNIRIDKKRDKNGRQPCEKGAAQSEQSSEVKRWGRRKARVRKKGWGQGKGNKELRDRKRQKRRPLNPEAEQEDPVALGGGDVGAKKINTAVKDKRNGASAD